MPAPAKISEAMPETNDTDHTGSAEGLSQRTHHHSGQSSDASHKKARKQRRAKPRFTQTQVYILAPILFTVSFIAMQYLCPEWPFMKRICMALTAAYLPSYFDGSEYTAEGRYWGWFAQHPLWRKLYSYFPAKIHFSEPLIPGQQYILSSHPHGAFSAHHWNYVSSPEFQKFFPGNRKRHLGASLVFRIPLFREWMLWGGIVDADSSLAHTILSEKYSMMALSGGISEQVRAHPGEHILFIKKRKGIFKLALQYGVPIVPCYCFGENDLFTTSHFLQKFRNFLADKWRFPICIGYGAFGTFFPHKKPLDAYVCAPISVEKDENPSTEAIEALQKRYIDEVVAIFDQHKAKHGYPNAQLKVM